MRRVGLKPLSTAPSGTLWNDTCMQRVLRITHFACHPKRRAYDTRVVMTRALCAGFGRSEVRFHAFQANAYIVNREVAARAKNAIVVVSVKDTCVLHIRLYRL